jgi:acyl carrier protein
MTNEDLRAIVLRELGAIAPEADLGTLDPKADLREALDIDSMDFLNFITAIHKKLGVEIAERDYPRLFTLAGAIDYLVKKSPRG